MGGLSEAFQAHLNAGLTTLCRCWAITRGDGTVLGFTDHDRDLSFEGKTFKANTGLSALALQQSTGLSVDNSEAIGALSDAAVRDADIEAGMFDGAELQSWQVNWADVTVRWMQFRGSVGEIRRGGGVFHAELRGLTEALNRPLGRVYQKPCTAVLGDGNCNFDTSTAGYFVELPVVRAWDSIRFSWDQLAGFDAGWFSKGRLSVMTGAAKGLWAMVKQDLSDAGERSIELWEPIRAPIGVGDVVRLEAGCDKRFETCRLKFGNIVNFQGFPDIPREDWMMAVPKKTGRNTGGSRR